jgi:hypothetical protein
MYTVIYIVNINCRKAHYYWNVACKGMAVFILCFNRRSAPEVANPRFCKNGALCAKRFTSYSNTAVARNREMWDRRLWH